MWELYAFWAFVPIMLISYQKLHTDISLNIPLLSFGIIAIGGLACVLGAFISEKLGTRRIAFLALLLSGICCLLSPFAFSFEIPILFLAFLFFWGMFVIADSPLFSTLVAQNVNPEIKGTALTIVNSIGFAITVVSIQTITFLQAISESNYVYLVLSIGPAFGLYFLFKKKTSLEKEVD
jgi:MFS family permease